MIFRMNVKKIYIFNIFAKYNIYNFTVPQNLE